MIKKFLVQRQNDCCKVAILKHKDKESYSFINLTKQHICPCEFPSIDAAVKDMDRLIQEGKIKSYTEIEWQW